MVSDGKVSEERGLEPGKGIEATKRRSGLSGHSDGS